MNPLFHHLPKTGGKSIRAWLQSQLHEKCIEFGPRNRCGELPCKMFWKYARGEKANLTSPAEALVGHYVFNELAHAVGWTEYQPLTLIRHPAERLYSQYHHYLRMNQVPSDFEAWVSQQGGVSICNCLFCFCDRQKDHHTTNPMVNFYASRGLKRDRGLGEAKLQLEKMQIFHTDRIGELVELLAEELGISASAYKPANVSGKGKEVSAEYSELVAELHPLDMELYSWASQEAGRSHRQ